jgi:hypothetical protein
MDSVMTRLSGRYVATSPGHRLAMLADKLGALSEGGGVNVGCCPFPYERSLRGRHGQGHGSAGPSAGTDLIQPDSEQFRTVPRMQGAVAGTLDP